MNGNEGTLEGRAGVEIFWRSWLPASEPRATVALAHGVSEHSGRYAHLGERLARSGYATYAVDHRGHGQSGGERALIEDVDDVVEDLRSLVELVGERHEGLPVFLLGHSMGGAISISYAVRHQETLAGLMLSGPLADPGAAGPLLRTVSRLLATLTPKIGLYAVESDAVSRDPEVVRDYDEDPLNHHGRLPAKTVAELLATVHRFPAEVGRIRLPLLVMHGGADELTPPAGSEMVHARAGSADKTLRIFDELYHEILNEPEREQVMDEIVAWLDQRA